MLLTPPPFEVEYSSEYYLTCPQDQATWSSWILCLCPRCIWCRRQPSSRCSHWCHRRVWNPCRSAVAVFQTRGPMSFQNVMQVFSTRTTQHFMGPLYIISTWDMDCPFQTMHMPLSVMAGWKCSDENFWRPFGKMSPILPAGYLKDDRSGIEKWGF